MLENKTYLKTELANKLTKQSSDSICKILFEDISNIDSLSKEEIDTIITRLTKDEPIQYITGVAPFYGHFFNVDNNVLIPRPETEELVYTIEKYIKTNGLESARILDIGTGSGCIPITLNKIFPDSKAVGVEVSESALLVAESNNTKLKSQVKFCICDFLNEENWKDLKDFNIVISNPPYIPHKERKLMSPNVLDHEPHLALFVENNDPLIFYRKIYHFVESQSQDIAVFLECNEYNASEVALLFDSTFKTEIIKDLQGKDRIVMATKIAL